MDITFYGKTALVTGAGRGIGREVAKALDAGGAQTYALSRTQSTLDSLQQECPDVRTICVDLSDWDATQSALKDLGRIDLLVNNAGIVDYSERTFFDVTSETFDQIFAVNVKGVINVSQIMAKGMIDSGVGGAIVNVSSLGSQKAGPMFISYRASKAALDQITRAMALELGPHKIRVNAVNPTMIPTDMALSVFPSREAIEERGTQNPLQKLGKVSDVVEPILFLLSDKSAMIHGHCLMVDGGEMVA